MNQSEGLSWVVLCSLVSNRLYFPSYVTCREAYPDNLGEVGGSLQVTPSLSKSSKIYCDGVRPPPRTVPPLRTKFHSTLLWLSGCWNPFRALNWGLAAACGCSRFSCMFLVVRRWFSSLNRWIAATSFSGSIRHSDLCVSIERESSRCPQPQGHSTSIPAGQISRCCHKSLRSISAPQLSFGQDTVMHGHSRARWTGMSPRLPTQRHP